MSKLPSRLFILGLCAILALVFAFYEMWILSHYFIGMLGFLLGVIGMKEKDKLSMFTKISGIELDMGDLDGFNKKEDTR